MPVSKVLKIQTSRSINNFLSINTQWKSKSKLKSEPQAVLEYGKAKLTWFEEIFEEYKQINPPVIWYWGIFEFPTLLSTSEGLQLCF